MRKGGGGGLNGDQIAAIIHLITHSLTLSLSLSLSLSRSPTLSLKLTLSLRSRDRGCIHRLSSSSAWAASRFVSFSRFVNNFPRFVIGLSTFIGLSSFLAYVYGPLQTFTPQPCPMRGAASPRLSQASWAPRSSHLLFEHRVSDSGHTHGLVIFD